MTLNPPSHLLSVRFVINLLLVGGTLVYAASSVAGSSINPISIQSDADFTAVGAGSGCACVTDTDANGTAIISSWQINANGVPGVSIVSTNHSITRAFQLDHITVHTAGNADGIFLKNIASPASITFANIDTPPSSLPTFGNRGINIVSSAGVSVFGGSVKSVGDWGLRISQSSGVSVNGIQVSHTGLANPNSESSATLPYDTSNPWLGGLIGSAPGGFLIIDSQHATIFNVNADSDGYAGIELVRSTNCLIDSSATQYPDYYGIVLQSSDSNTISNSTFGASDYNGLVLRNSSYNNILNNRIGATGAIGVEFAARVVAYFTSSMYIGWGSHDNQVHGNSGKTSAPSFVIDDGFGPTLALPASARGMPQTKNPLNDQSSGGNPGSYAGFSGLGVFPTPYASAAGTQTQAEVCGNSFSGAAGYNTVGIDPNQVCP